MSFDKQGLFSASQFYVLRAIWKQYIYIYHIWWKYMFILYTNIKPFLNFRTLLPGTFKGNIRIRKLWLHHNPLRWVEQNIIVCWTIFHHMQHFYNCIMVLKKKSIMFTFVNAPHSIFFSLAIPPLKTGPKQNDALNLATLDQIKNHQQHHRSLSTS